MTGAAHVRCRQPGGRKRKCAKPRRLCPDDVLVLQHADSFRSKTQDSPKKAALAAAFTLLRFPAMLLICSEMAANGVPVSGMSHRLQRETEPSGGLILGRGITM